MNGNWTLYNITMTERITKWVNPEVLKNIRKRHNLTESEVEEISKGLKKQYFEPITAEQLIDWEMEGLSQN